MTFLEALFSILGAYFEKRPPAGTPWTFEHKHERAHAMQTSERTSIITLLGLTQRAVIVFITNSSRQQQQVQ